MLMELLTGINNGLKATYLNRVVENLSKPQVKASDYVRMVIPEIRQLYTGIEDEKDRRDFINLTTRISSKLNAAPFSLMFKRDTIDIRWDLWYLAEDEFKEIISILQRHYGERDVDKLALYLGRKTA